MFSDYSDRFESNYDICSKYHLVWEVALVLSICFYKF
jgi:hypothetical protein